MDATAALLVETVGALKFCGVEIVTPKLAMLLVNEPVSCWYNNCALLRLVRIPTASWALVLSIEPVNFGMAKDAITPRIMTTTITSSIVNPVFFIF